VDLVFRLSDDSLLTILIGALGLAVRERVDLTPDEMTQALVPFQWMLDHARDGLTLTSAGYLKPADVVQLCDVLPAAHRWIGKKNREDHTPPAWDFRLALTTCRLIRKHKGQLILTPGGRRAVTDPAYLWNYLAWQVIDTGTDVIRQATILHLICLAAGVRVRPDFIAAALNELGWRVGKDDFLEDHDVWRLRDTVDAITENLHNPESPWQPEAEVPAAVRAFALTALTLTEPPPTRRNR